SGPGRAWRDSLTQRGGSGAGRFAAAAVSPKGFLSNRRAIGGRSPGWIMIGTTAGQHKSLLDDYCAQLGSLLERRHTERVLIAARQNAEGAARLAEEALRQARATDRAKTTFLANVTHERRTPLNAIIGFS